MKQMHYGMQCRMRKILGERIEKSKKIQIVTTIKIIKRKDKRQWDI